MNHLEAQSLITSFIDNKIPSDKQEDFVVHMKNCPECHKELEIYYTLLVGMKQIDNGEKLSEDFDLELDKSLDRMKGRSRGRRRAIVSSFSLIMISIITVMVLIYGQSLAKVYKYEQNSKKEAQGDFYFYRELNNYINTDNNLFEDISSDDDKTEGEIFYEKIHLSNSLFNANNELLNIGEEKIIEREDTPN